MITGFLSAVVWTGIFLSPLLEAKLHIALVTHGEKHSSTNHWVKFRVKGDKGLSDWMYPEASGRDFKTGRQMKTAFNEKSVGNIRTVYVKVERFKPIIIDDAWQGYKVIISDSETRKTYAVYPKWVKTDETKTLSPRSISCRNTRNDCKCHTNVSLWGNVGNIFRIAKYEIDDCPLACGYCYGPKRRDEPTSAEGSGETGSGEGPSVESASADSEGILDN